jgi:hypothetical protein
MEFYEHWNHGLLRSDKMVGVGYLEIFFCMEIFEHWDHRLLRSDKLGLAVVDLE